MKIDTLEPAPAPAPAPAPDASCAPEVHAATDGALLDRLQRAAFDFFPLHTHPTTGLVADASRPGAPCSIASVGFASSCYPAAVERGWIERGEAVRLILLALRFFAASEQSDQPRATGYRGFYYHFLESSSGARTWQCELSMIDSALLVAGFLTAAAYFDRDTPDESELRRLADALYRRVDWRWSQNGKATVSQGWKPEHGFLSYGWEGYSEAILLYALGLGSPTHPLDHASFREWTMTYQWENQYGCDVLYAGPLFIHQVSHAWLDLRGLRDDFMREKKLDYFENTRRAVCVQREYAKRNPLGFTGYGESCWSISAGDGPAVAPVLRDGRTQRFFGYAARGAPYGPDDGTICGPAALASIAFAPELVWPMLRKVVAEDTATTSANRLLASGFNASVMADAVPGFWVSEQRIGFDQGLVMLLIENHRSGLVWRLTRRCGYLRDGLARAGFRGGWLDCRGSAAT